MNATPTYEQEQAEHHASLAESARKSAETYRRYLEWSTDPAQRRWAEALAAAADMEADAEAEYAATLRDRVPA